METGIFKAGESIYQDWEGRSSGDLHELETLFIGTQAGSVAGTGQLTLAARRVVLTGRNEMRGIETRIDRRRAEIARS